MKTYKTQPTTISVLDKILCNYCGELIPATFPGQFEFAYMAAHWGYGSKHDMEHFEIQICEKCVYEKILPQLAIQPEIEEYL